MIILLPRVIGDSIDLIRVLHVDDDPNQFEFIKFFLNQIDPVLDVHCVATPEDVIREIDENEYDCFITDFQMPLMNGIELARKVREKSNIPIILYTGQGSEEVAESAFNIGIDDYLRKEMDPSHYQVLAKRIRHVVEKKRTETLYQRVVEGISDGLCIVVNGKIVYANQVQADLFGVKNIEDILGSRAIDFVHPEDRVKAESRMKERAKGNLSPPFYKYRIKQKNGEIREVEALANIIKYNGKKGFVVLTRDLTERLKLEEEKKKSEERFRHIIELAPDGIVTVSLNGIVTSANPAFLDITGYKKEEVIGKRFYQLGTLRKIDLRNNLKIFSQIIRGKIPPPVEFVFQYKDGTQGWGEAHLGFIDKNKEKELIAIVRDITERKWVEKEFKKHQEEEKQLTQKKHLDTSKEEKNPWSTHLNSGIGVELQETLFLLKNNLLILKKDPSKLEKIIDIMESSVDTASIQLKELFEEEQATKLQPCKIFDILENTLNEIHIPKKIKINKKFSGKNFFYVEPNKLKKAIKDVLNTSVRSMNKEGTINIICETVEDSLLIEINVTSHVLTHEDQKALMSNGYIKKKSICYSIKECKKHIEEHKGSIFVNSTEEKGTTYTIVLPRDYRRELVTNEDHLEIHGLVSQH